MLHFLHVQETDAMSKRRSCIEPLPVEARLQLGSSVTLNSLNDAVVGLIKNSLDAEAQTINIEIDYLRGNCCVEDDGVGIPGAEFEAGGGLGLMHYTSKFADSSEIHGHYGRFLASLSASSLLSISSRHLSRQYESSIVYHHSQVLTRQFYVPPKEQKVGTENGTRVVVRDLFGNLAVRLKRRAIQFDSADHVERELDRLRQQISAVALAWPKPVRVVVSDQQSQQRRLFAMGTRVKAGRDSWRAGRDLQGTSTFRLDHICTILSHAGYIMPIDLGSWTSVSARTSQTFVRAAICLQPAPSKQVQFISLGVHPLDCSSTLSQVLYREVNGLFAKSAFGTVEDDVDISEEERLRRLRDRRFKGDFHTDRQVKGRGKGADRWPMFYFRIEFKDSQLPPSVLKSDEDDKQAAKFLMTTVQLIRSMTLQFLQEYHFRPRARRRRSRHPFSRERMSTAGVRSNSDLNTGCHAQPVKDFHQIARDNAQPVESSVAKHISSKCQTEPNRLPAATSFASWSKTKSAKPRALDNLLSGLPRGKSFQELKRGTVSHIGKTSLCDDDCVHQSSLAEECSDEEVQLLLREVSEDPDNEEGICQSWKECEDQPAPPSNVSEHHEGSPLPKQADSEDGIIVWKNPISGKSIRIKARTGLSLPYTPLHPTCELQSSDGKILSSCSDDIRSSLKNRSVDSRQGDQSVELQSVSNSWLHSLLTGWQNPVFRLKERPIPSAVLEEEQPTLTRAQKCCHSQYHHCPLTAAGGRDGRLSKSALASANILGQVDKKFILATMRTSGSETFLGAVSEAEDTALVLIDQHAADERYRIEELYAEISKSSPVTTTLSKPIVIEITAQEYELFRRDRSYFETWGIMYSSSNEGAANEDGQAIRPLSARPRPADIQADISQRRPASAIAQSTSVTSSNHGRGKHSRLRVIVHALPALIAERCRLEPKLLIDILRADVWARTEGSARAFTLLSRGEDTQTDAGNDHSLHAWLKYISSCPRGIVDLLNSRACRSAIMFNDELTKPECEELVKKLAKCAFPFQCAHGRPSMVVVGGLDDSAAMQSSKPTTHEVPGIDSSMQTRECENRSFLRAFDRWQHREELESSSIS